MAFTFIASILRLLASVISLYALLCFIRILLTWFPALSYSKAAQFLAAICDPFLNKFRGIKWLTLGSIDFSPALALCLLSAASSILNGLASGAALSVGGILALLLDLFWTIIFSLITFIILLLAIRLIIIFASRSEYSSSPIISTIDRSIAPLVQRLAGPFRRGRAQTYKAALIISIIMLILLNFAGLLLSSFLNGLLLSLPF
ncbi:MAG: YggT family protein [Treponema sp.]|nr:YggT family protein [Treponema sp.]